MKRRDRLLHFHGHGPISSSVLSSDVMGHDQEMRSCSYALAHCRHSPISSLVILLLLVMGNGMRYA